MTNGLIEIVSHTLILRPEYISGGQESSGREGARALTEQSVRVV